MSRRYVSLFAVSLFAAPLFALPAPAAAAAPVQVPAGSVAAKKDFCRITASAATVRAKPRKNAAALGTAYKGNTCTAHGWAEGDGTWVKVTIKRTGVIGYVHSSLVAWGKEGLGRTSP
ncbi:SH3 domain-containing protein [Streptomyces vastus]|uniref:SH3b domain-containing protein n=1 Tax=Streptomyces vastus TaxID=285451 RepID=A0ABN3RRH0_9ACTN